MNNRRKVFGRDALFIPFALLMLLSLTLLPMQILSVSATTTDDRQVRPQAIAAAEESDDLDDLDELEDVMKRMGRTVKALRKASTSEQILDYSLQLRKYIGRASQMPPEDPEDARIFGEGIEQLITAADKLVEVSRDGGDVDTAVKELLSIRKKYHKALGV